MFRGSVAPWLRGCSGRPNGPRKPPTALGPSGIEMAAEGSSASQRDVRLPIDRDGGGIPANPPAGRAGWPGDDLVLGPVEAIKKNKTKSLILQLEDIAAKEAIKKKLLFDLEKSSWSMMLTDEDRQRMLDELTNLCEQKRRVRRGILEVSCPFLFEERTEEVSELQG